MKKVPITIFTPTYNRAYLLEILYRSLVAQTCIPMEWLIVDDGSTDNTRETIEGFIQENKLNIRYYYFPNGGKHRAINQGVKLALGELFFIVDSDDVLPVDSLEVVSRYWTSIPEIDRKYFAGVSGLKADFSGKTTGSKFPYSDGCDYIDATYSEIRYRDKVTGDKAEVYRTSLLKEYPFTEFPGENFLTEGTVWTRIALQGYPLRWFNHVIYNCEYLPGGLSNRFFELATKNPKGYAYFYNQEQLYAGGWMINLYNSYNYYFFSLLARRSLSETFAQDSRRGMVFLGLPLAWLKRIFYSLKMTVACK